MQIGGIETFFIRMAKERKKSNLVTKFFFTKERFHSNDELIRTLSDFAQIYFINDLYVFRGYFSEKYILISPIYVDRLLHLLSDVDHIHVTCGLNALLANRFREISRKSIKITVGFYHSLEFTWGTKISLPYFERTHRSFVFKHLPKENLFTFGEETLNVINRRLNLVIHGTSNFKIGVIETENLIKKRKFNSDILKIVSVGRFVDFKTYHLWMIDVVLELNKIGIKTTFDMYGSGPLFDNIKSKILSYNISNLISFKGELPYSEFNLKISKYDLFIGSGTSLIQASSLGVPSIIAIESINEPLTYGFFHEFSNTDYNIPDLLYPKISITSLIKDFYSMTLSDKFSLSIKHIHASKAFLMSQCSENFNLRGRRDSSKFEYSKFLYELSCRIFNLKKKLLLFKKNKSNYYYS